MNKKWHKETIEALGMMASKPRIVNKLNAVAAKSDDPKLRKYAKLLINELESTSSNTAAMRPKDMKNGVPTASKAIAYCKSVAFAE